ncbi:MAG: lipoyl(octanoyl) transferase LipB [Proteobacteria bacterium]|nr:lipoyl(octanoyl) transferase LipB [Pseudomonadota bacterium]
MSFPKIIIRRLGLQPYPETLQSMQKFTMQRTDNTDDELWLLEHPAVFTQGQAGKAEHIINPHHIPVIQTDRGGQITYHGPGQLVAYPLLNLNRLQISIRGLVSSLENCIIALLNQFHIQAHSVATAPGVYVEGKKICSIGLRVKKSCSFHGIALNIKMDLTPFSYINPCGYKGLIMTQLAEFTPEIDFTEVLPAFIATFLRQFGYTNYEIIDYQKWG